MSEAQNHPDHNSPLLRLCGVCAFFFSTVNVKRERKAFDVVFLLTGYLAFLTLRLFRVASTGTLIIFFSLENIVISNSGLKTSCCCCFCLPTQAPERIPGWNESLGLTFLGIFTAAVLLSWTRLLTVDDWLFCSPDWLKIEHFFTWCLTHADF